MLVPPQAKVTQKMGVQNPGPDPAAVATSQ